ncbi:DUF3179 domain-containing protein [Patescibacteria group bacterium]
MDNVRPIIVVALIISLGFLVIVLKFPMSSEKREEITNFINGEDIPVEITEDYDGAKVPPAKLLRGCPNKDCIPSIDEPEFQTVKEANVWLEDNDKVFGLNYKGEAKAYPQRILNWHELVNDVVADDPIAVAFCPLAGTPTAFIRKINGTTSDFGISGYLYKSNLIMYDRKFGNLWQQVTHEAIIGKAARDDQYLERLNISTTTWGQWKAAYPNTVVLKKPLGETRDYDRYPYGSYEENSEVRFGATHTDKRLHSKDIVYGIRIGETPKAYSEVKINLVGTFEDTVGGQTIVVGKAVDGSVVIKNKATGEQHYAQRSFWFAWVIFNPNTLLY